MDAHTDWDRIVEPDASRYSLATLFEYMTICSVLSAAGTLVGLFSSACLMLLALALFARRGVAALVALAAALLACDIAPHTAEFGTNLDRPGVVFFLAGVLCMRCLARRKRAAD